MTTKPVIFISSTSDLRSARDLVGKVLYSMGYDPSWQEIEPTDGGELLDVLRHRIAPCEMVIQLVGDRYGAEPPYPSPEFGRVSYTQFEAMFAEQLGRKVVYHFLTGQFPVDAVSPESDELHQLQSAYRDRIIKTNRLHQADIASPQDLELSIHRIRDELTRVRKEGERRSRRLMVIAAASLIGICAIGSLVVYQIHGESHITAKFDQMTARLDESENLIKQFLAERPLDANGKPIIPQLKGDLLARALQMIGKGNKRQRLEAAVAMNDFETADRLQADIRVQNKTERQAEDFDLAMLEGDRWYRATDFDKAIPPYEQAFALRPDDFKTRSSLTTAHTSARLGNIANHRHRAIEIATGTLLLIRANSGNWAVTQNQLGVAWSDLPTGDKGENLRRAIVAYEAALTVSTKETDPCNWAGTQANLGSAWSQLPTGDKTENQQRAVAAYEAVLTVFTKETDPGNWAMTQNNLGNVWMDFLTGNKTINLQKAIGAYESALTVYTRQSYPNGWAAAQNNLGNAWANLPSGEKERNLQKAIAAYTAALTVRTKEADPGNWAMTQYCLGGAWLNTSTGDKAENLQKAIAAYDAALTVQTRETDPRGWAQTQHNLGIAWFNLSTGDKAENLQNAIAAFSAGLLVQTKEAEPNLWVETQASLGSAWFNLPTGDKAANLQKAIAAYEAALTIWTKDTDPLNWAKMQTNLGHAWLQFPLGDNAANLQKAIAGYEAALTVFTQVADPGDWAGTETDLGTAWSQLPSGDKGLNLHKAVTAYKAALTIQTRQANPVEWATTQFSLGAALGQLGNLQEAARCFKRAAQIPGFVAQNGELVKQAMSMVKDAYNSSPAAATQPFDSIAPAD